MAITKGERAELRSLVKQQFRVLGQEVDERRAELEAEVTREVDARFEGERRRRDAIRDRVGEILGAAQREITDVLKDEDVGVTPGRPYYISGDVIRWEDDGSKRLIQQARADIEAKVRAAKLKLARQEADLLRELSVGAIESEEARRFLGSIPTVGELVPAASLPMLEQPDGES